MLGEQYTRHYFEENILMSCPLPSKSFQSTCDVVCFLGGTAVSKKGYLLKSSATAARSSMNVLPYEPILSYLSFLKNCLQYYNALRIFGLSMELKHSNLKVRPGALPQRVAFFGERTVHTGNLLHLVCTLHPLLHLVCTKQKEFSFEFF